MNQIWTTIEEQFIKENAGLLTDALGAAQLSEIAGRKITVYAWRKKRQKLGLTKAPGRGICRLLDVNGN